MDMMGYQRVLAMVQELLLSMGAVEGEVDQERMEIETGAVRSRDKAEADELQRQAEVLEDIRYALETARREIDHHIESEPEPVPETDEAA